MKKSIGKPCEGKLHARFDEGGADCFIIFVLNNNRAIRLYSTQTFPYIVKSCVFLEDNIKISN